MEIAVAVVGRNGEGRTCAIPSDERLMARVRSGDEGAFGCIYDRYAGCLLTFCHHMLGSREEAEDALQHVFVAAHRQMRHGPHPQQLKPWLYAVARNRCLSVLRSRHETLPLDDALEPAGHADVSREAEQREDVRAVLADVAALPYAQREALVLAEVGAMSHEEIAETLGVRKDKVKALVYQARQSLMVSREARETSCRDIQERLSVLQGAALRRGAIRRHVDRCPACAAFKGEVQRQRSLLAAAFPVIPATALKSTILGAAGSAAAGPAGAGMAGLGSSALLAKVLAVGAVAGVAVGGGTAVVGLRHAPDPAAAAPARSVATTTTPARVQSASVSAVSRTAARSGPAMPHRRGAERPGRHQRPDADRRAPVVGPERPASSSDASAVTIGDPPPSTPTVSEDAGSSAAAIAPGRAQPDAAATEPAAATPLPATPLVTSGQSEGAKPDAPPGQAKGAKPDAPPGQANSAKPDAPPGQANSAKPDAPPGQANSAKPDAPPGQTENGKPDSPPGQAISAKPDAPPGQAENGKPDAPPGQANRPASASSSTP